MTLRPSAGETFDRGGWRWLAGARRLVHRKYLRALVFTASLVTIPIAFGASALALRYEISPAASLRYFTRLHYREADLGRLVAHPGTAGQLARLFEARSRFNPGGLVYADGDQLRFYLHETRESGALRAVQVENEAIFARLAPTYHAADLDGLIAGLQAPAVKRRLRGAGVDPRQLVWLRRQAASAPEGRERNRVLRRAARLLLHFVPYHGSAYSLGFAEKLRFYDQNEPRGRFVGIFEVYGWQVSPDLDASAAHARSQHNHFLTIARVAGAKLLVQDFYRGRETRYVIQPVDLPTGDTLFTVRTVS